VKRVKLLLQANFVPQFSVKMPACRIRNYKWEGKREGEEGGKKAAVCRRFRNLPGKKGIGIMYDQKERTGEQGFLWTWRVREKGPQAAFD